MHRQVQVNDMMPTYIDVYEFGSGSPKIAITGGIHGNEVSGIHICKKLVEYFEENPPLKGSVVVLPICNPIAFRQMERANSFDRKDMNRSFPGSAQGSYTERLAHAVMELTKDADMIIDLHNCGQNSQSYTLAVYSEYPKTRKLADLLNIPALVHSGGASGQLFIEACKRGQAALIIEMPNGPGPGAINRQSTKQGWDGVMNALRHEGFVSGDCIQNEVHAFGPIKHVTAAENGLWKPAIKSGDWAKAGETTGTLNGNPILAPADCYALTARPKSYIACGEFVVAYLVKAE